MLDLRRPDGRLLLPVRLHALAAQEEGIELVPANRDPAMVDHLPPRSRAAKFAFSLDSPPPRRCCPPVHAPTANPSRADREPFVLSSFAHSDDEGWTLEHRVVLSRLWADGDHPWLPLPEKTTPQIIAFDPLNGNVIYLSAGEHVVVVDLSRMPAACRQG